MRAADQEGVDGARALTNTRYHLDDVSRTFHARDIFSPVAAHLAAGVPFADLGDSIDPDALFRVDLPEPEIGSDKLVANVVTVDRFGNLSLNVTREHLGELSLVPGDWVELQFSLDPYYAQVAETYADAGRGELILYVDSYDAIAIAVRDGSAARLTGAGPGDRVRLRVTATPE